MDAPNVPNHIHIVSKMPAGIRNAIFIKTNNITNLIAQNPFSNGARTCLDDFTPIINMAIVEKKQNIAKVIR